MNEIEWQIKHIVEAIETSLRFKNVVMVKSDMCHYRGCSKKQERLGLCSKHLSLLNELDTGTSFDAPGAEQLDDDY